MTEPEPFIEPWYFTYFAFLSRRARSRLLRRDLDAARAAGLKLRQARRTQQELERRKREAL